MTITITKKTGAVNASANVRTLEPHPVLREVQGEMTRVEGNEEVSRNRPTDTEAREEADPRVEAGQGVEADLVPGVHP